MPWDLTPTAPVGGTTLMSYTFLSLKNIALEAAGQNNRTNNSPDDIVNDAIQYLTTLHHWPWRQKALSLSVAADVEYTALPDDFAEILTLHYAANSLVSLEPASLQRIMQLRAAGDLVDTGAGRLLYAIENVPQLSITTLPTCRLALWPTPAADASAAILGTYLRHHRKLTLNTEVVDMPGNVQMLLRVLVKAMAVAGLEQQTGVEWDLFNQMLPQYILGANRQMPGIGPMQTIYDQTAPRFTPTISVS